MSDLLDIKIDVRKLNQMFKDLDMSTASARKALRKGLADSARIIQKQGKANLSLVQNAASGKQLAARNLKKWAKYVVYKRTLGFRVHIQQSRGASKKENKSFLLKFFEEGTDDRYNKRLKRGRYWARRLHVPRYTGKITASHLFSSAVKTKSRESEMSLMKNIEKHIQKQAKKNE